MKNFILLVALFLVAPFAQGSSPQHLLVGGSGWNKIAIINKDTKEIVWEYPLEKAIINKKLSCAQCLKLMSLYTFDNDKLKMLQVLKDHIADTTNYQYFCLQESHHIQEKYYLLSAYYNYPYSTDTHKYIFLFLHFLNSPE